MTRLTEYHLTGLCENLEGMDLELKQKTGLTLSEIACIAAGIGKNGLVEARADNIIAVVPVTAGQGLIRGFAQAVRSILCYLGFTAFITEETDVAGIADGVTRGASILFMADDHRFIALDCKSAAIVDNSYATGRGYVAALDGMAGGLRGKEVLVIGRGRVGISALAFARELGATVAVHDLVQGKLQPIKPQCDIKVEADLNQALSTYKYLLDACPGENYMDVNNLHLEAMIAAPGIPLGLTGDAYAAFSDRIVHDQLQIGVATMLAILVNRRL